ncbi:hypothetical protein [Microvirga pudoricolor]|uniref:hypothetical protein n=1 Tax=Microvirga pudoricolor TaxID=2778729 RepID=UPI001951D8A3|nr:hypothetical protein [Microvirga pudoricolor]MBM6593030.1 hypothetical protein [Microvirga pudoricolor]
MMDALRAYFEPILTWAGWDWLRLTPATPPISGNIFSFAEYLAALALLLVVLSASDFRFRYRLSVTRLNLRITGFWVGLGIGFSILVIDVWFQNGLPIPKFLNNANNLKAILGFVFLAFVFKVMAVALIRPQRFRSSNAEQFLAVNYHFIHEGNPERLQVIAEELRDSARWIVACAAKYPDREHDSSKATIQQQCAINLLLLIGDIRFCRVVVEKVPTLAFVFFEEAHKYRNRHLPIYQFCRNIGQEFIRNESSSFYQENGSFYSGLLGYTRPVSNTIFGNYEFVEKCAADGASPLDMDFVSISGFTARQMEAYSRAALAFLESNLKATRGLSHPHSYALARLLSSMDHALYGLSSLNDSQDYLTSDAYGRLKAVVSFVEKAIELAENYAKKPVKLTGAKRDKDQLRQQDIFDKLAGLIFEIVLAASDVSSPAWAAWTVQHNSTWGQIFGLRKTKAAEIIRLRLQRLMYEEIVRMSVTPNFKGARILGYCLNVLGLTLPDRRKGYGREFYPLQLMALRWVKTNYRKLLNDHPNVAAACILGSVSYDAEHHRLVSTDFSKIRKEPNREYFELD